MKCRAAGRAKLLRTTSTEMVSMSKPKRSSFRGASSRVPFWRAGHSPTLVAAFLYFNFTFMAWVLLGPLAVQIAADLKLSAAEQGLMIATPLLAGAILRVAMGMLADRLQPRLAGAIGQGVVIAALMAVWLIGVDSYAEVLALGVVLGLAGASFAAALRLASGIYPPEHRGLALGITGAGNFGTVLAAFFGPSLAAAWGWQNVLGMALVPLILAFAYYLLAARDGGEPTPVRRSVDYLRVLRNHDALWFMFFYAVSFGGFVGLASFLTVYFATEFGLTAVSAGYCAALCCCIGSVFRPFGVHFAERLGHSRRHGGGGPGAGGHRPALALERAGGVRHCHAGAGHGQRRDIPGGAAALSSGDERDDGDDRHGRGRRRLFAGGLAGIFAAGRRQLPRRLFDVRRLRGNCADRPGGGENALAQPVARCRRPRLSLTWNPDLEN
jgi:MFS family permease